MNKLSDKLNLKKDFPYTSYDEWKSAVEKDLKGVPFEKKLITKTYEGIDLNPLYTADDLKNNPLTENFPGFTNFARGSNAKSVVESGWIISQDYNYADVEKINEAVRFDLTRGLNGINLKFDLPTQMNLDPDSAEKNLIGTDGTSVSTLEDIEKCFKNIDISKLKITIEAGFSSTEIFSLVISYLKKSGFNLKNLSINILSNPLGFALKYGKIPYDFKTAYDEIYTITKWCIDNKINFKTIGINGDCFVNAGASAVQEHGYSFAIAIEYIEEMLERGLKIDEITNRFHFTFGLGTFYFMEISKLRAARILWSNIIDIYGGNEKSKEIFIHSKTSLFNQTQNDIYVNLLRTTTEAFSAIVGGANSIHTSSFDETLNEPDEFARRIARNTQIILREESHLNNVIDPAGGSYFVESLTVEIAQKSFDLIKDIISKGGMLKAIKEGIPQSEIKKVFDAKEKDFAKRKSVIVGNNMYANINEEKPEQKETNANFTKDRIEYIKDFRTSGEDAKHKKVMDILQKISSDNSIDLLIDAFENSATLGEVSKSLSRKESKEKIQTLLFKRASESFEELRNLSYSYKDKNGELPKIFLVTMGGLKQHKARADFARGFFEVGGFNVIYKKGFDTTNEAVKEAIASCAKIVTICSTDDTYPEIVPVLAKKLKKNIPGVVLILAGYPKEQIEEHKKNGIDEFIFLGTDVYSINKKLLS